MNSILFRVLSSLFPLQWGSKYTRLDKTPRRWEFRLLSAMIRLRHSLTRQRVAGPGQGLEESASLRRLRQRFLAFSVPAHDIDRSDATGLPAVRLLWVSHPKDFDVLSHSVLGALRHVRNPVAAIDVVSPSLGEAERRLTPLLPASIAITYLHDDDVVSKSLRKELTQALSSHGAWATQQLIKVLMAISHPSEPTLVIDSDTVLLRDKVWLTSAGRQLLYFRGYTNPRYQHYLRSWGVSEIDDLRSFVTHHMLFQPEILSEAISKTFRSTNPRALVSAIISSAQELGFPEFSMDYELYGNVLWARHRDTYQLDKYSNVGLPRPDDSTVLESALTALRQEGRYNSASFHLPER